MVRLILQSLKRRKFQALANLVGIAAGVAVLMAVALFYTGVEQGVELGRQRLGADLLVIPNNAGLPPETALFTGVPANFYMPESLRDQVAALPGVKQVSAQFFTQTLDESCCSIGGPYRLIGFDPGSDWLVTALLGEERAGALGEREVVVGGSVAARAGQEIMILDEWFTVAQVLPPTGTGLDESILMPMAMAKALAKASPALQEIWQKEGEPDHLISALLVIAEGGVDLEALAAAVESLGRYRAVPTLSLFAALKEQFTFMVAVVFLCGLLLVGASLLQLTARLSAMVWDRKAEWGLYRALGASRCHLFRLIAGEGVLLSVGGALIGMGAGTVLYKLAMDYLLARQAFPHLPPDKGLIAWWILAVLVFFSLISLVASWFSAWKAAGLDPAVAMAKGDID